MGFTDKNKKSRLSNDYDKDSRGPATPNKTLSKATCGSCGSSCTVPFRPSAGKPVYCNACFRKDTDFSDRKSTRYDREPGARKRDRHSSERRSDRRPDINLDQINAKLDRILRLLDN